MNITALAVPPTAWSLTEKGGDSKGFQVLAFGSGDDHQLYFFVRDGSKLPFGTRLIGEKSVAELHPQKQ